MNLSAPCDGRTSRATETPISPTRVLLAVNSVTEQARQRAQMEVTGQIFSEARGLRAKGEELAAGEAANVKALKDGA